MALAGQPRMLLLDEPMAGLGPEESARMVANAAGAQAASSPSCWSSTTWKRCSRSPTASPCWSMAASSPPARPDDDPRQRARCARPISANRGGRLMSDAILELDGDRDLLRPEPGAVRHFAHHRAGRDGDADGPQRHGQDHHGALDHGADPGARRLDARFLGQRNPRPAALSRSPSAASAWCRKAGRSSPTSRCGKISSPPRVARDGGDWTLERVYDLFPRLAERATSMGNQLSGGEQQMLAVGRALMTNPRLLILDEATEGLAPLIRQEIWRCLARLKAVRPVGPGDRQECRRADARRRPPLPDRARARGVERGCRRSSPPAPTCSIAICGV